MTITFKDLVVASGLSQSKVADHISMRSLRPCTERDVRAWIAPPEVKTGRACPEWAYATMIGFMPKVNIAA
jgi:hypothetical protein